MSGENDIPVNHYKLCGGIDPDEGEDKFLTVTLSSTVRQSGRFAWPANWSRQIEFIDGLEFVEWVSASVASFPKLDNADRASWITIRYRAKPGCDKASGGTCKIEFANQTRSRVLNVPEACWRRVVFVDVNDVRCESEGWATFADFECGQDQSFVFLAEDAQSIFSLKSTRIPVGPLAQDEWVALITVESENVSGFEGTLRFDITSRGVSNPKSPAFTKLRSLPPRLSIAK